MTLTIFAPTPNPSTHRAGALQGGVVAEGVLADQVGVDVIGIG